MKFLLLAFTLTSAIPALAAGPTVLVRCSSSGIVSLESYEIAFVRHRFSIAPATGDSSYVITRVHGGQKETLSIDGASAQVGYSPIGKLRTLLFDAGDTKVDVSISGRSSHVLLSSPSVTAHSAHLTCSYPAL